MSNLIQALRKPGNEISKWFYFKPPIRWNGSRGTIFPVHTRQKAIKKSRETTLHWCKPVLVYSQDLQTASTKI